MIFLKSHSVRIISVVVLFFFLWTFGGVFDIAYAINSSIEQKSSSAEVKNQSKAQRPEEKFQKVIEDIESILTDTDTVTDTDTKMNKLRSKNSEVESLDVEIKRQFKDTEEKIKDLPEVIKQRHRDFVKKYEENLNTLRTNLDAIEKAKTKEQEAKEVEKLRSFLEKVKPPKKHVPLDPNKLPHRTAEPVFKEPRLKPEEFLKDSSQYTVDSRQGTNYSSQQSVASRQKKPILVASNGSLAGLLTQNSELGTQNLLVASASNAPTDADLTETIEVQFTPEIQAKAAELNYNPVKIYNWVRNNIEFVPTYGSIQGANMCLQTKQCNDFDTASLLIALLRASNIPAKYVYGTIELPIEKVMNWVGGFTDSNSALNLIASGGIPVTGFTSGGKIVMVRMEHVWVEAWIDYLPSRGAKHKTGQGDTWIPLDASFKQYNYAQGINIQTAVGIDPQTFYSQLASTVTIDPVSGAITNIDVATLNNKTADLKNALTNYLDANMANTELKDIIGGRAINQVSFELLPASLPYKTISILSKYSVISDSLRYKISIQMIDEYGFPLMAKVIKNFPELAGKRITISYDPATSNDEAVLKNYATETAKSLPAYLINLLPALKIEGTTITVGTSVQMGTPVTLNLSFIDPRGRQDNITHQRVVGDFSALVLNYGSVGGDFLSKRVDKLQATKILLESGQYNKVAKDEILGEILNVSMLGYWGKTEFVNKLSALAMDIASVQLPSEGLNSLAIATSYFFGVPYMVTGGGMSIDIQRNLMVVVSKNGNSASNAEYMFHTGSYGSYMESAIYDEIFQQPEAGISAVSIIKLAAQQGIPIFTVNKNNINSILPLLRVDSTIKADIANAVNAGKYVMIPQQNISHNGWVGVGYIILDPNTGAGAYMISGGQAGGWSPIDWFNNLGAAGKVITIIILGLVAAVVITLLIVAIVKLSAAIIGFIIASVIPMIYYLSALAFITWSTLRATMFISCIITALEIWSKYTPDPNPIPGNEDVPILIGITTLLIMINGCIQK